MGMAVCTSVLCRPKLIQETVFDNIEKDNMEHFPENTNDIFIYIVSSINGKR